LIPAFCAESFLPRLLRSAQAQTVPFHEIRVYDDASPDRTAEVAASFGALVTRGETNRGCSHGKNQLARATACDWLHFHDADDELRPDFVEKALPWMRASPPRDVIFFSYETRFHEDGRHNDYRRFNDIALRADPLGYVLAEQINPFCGLYRRAPFLAAGGWDEDPLVLQSEDQAGHLRLALAGLSFAADPAVTIINYLRKGSMTTGNLPGANRSTFHVLEKALRSGLAPAHIRIVGTRLWKIAGHAAAYLDWPAADRAAALAASTRAPLPQETGNLLRMLAPLSPRVALRVRETLIRRLRPASRVGTQFHPPTAR
jgi:glycosyltransferase involved in cell wall biosynthesis